MCVCVAELVEKFFRNYAKKPIGYLPAATPVIPFCFGCLRPYTKSSGGRRQPRLRNLATLLSFFEILELKNETREGDTNPNGIFVVE